MMLLKTPLFRLSTSLTIFAIFTVTFIFYTIGREHVLGKCGIWGVGCGVQESHLTMPESTSQESQYGLTEKEEWVKLAMNAVIGGKYDNTAIKALCAKRSFWASDVALQGTSTGGIGNIRNELLLSLRYAIDAGIGMVLPLIELRDADLIELNTGDFRPMDYLFDTSLFLQRIHDACPDMPIYETLSDLPLPLISIGVHPRGWERSHPESKGNFTSIPEITAKRAPVGTFTFVRFAVVFEFYPVCRDGVSFADNFGQLFSFREDTTRLAGEVLYEMSRRFNLNINPRGGITTDSYLGVHLRTSADAVAADFPPYEEQASQILAHVFERHLPVTYIASGDKNSTAQLIKEINSSPTLADTTTVVTKTDLLSHESLVELAALDWDQQALVDYLVLLRSSFFYGTERSSFSANVAFRRRTVSKQGTCGVNAFNDEYTYLDEYSELNGDRPSVWNTRMWP